MKRVTKAELERRIGTMTWFNGLPFVIASRRHEQGLRGQRGFIPVEQYGHGMEPVRPGEIGFYYGHRYFTADGKPEKAR